MQRPRITIERPRITTKRLQTTIKPPQTDRITRIIADAGGGVWTNDTYLNIMGTPEEKGDDVWVNLSSLGTPMARDEAGGIIVAARGRSGGYELADSPENLTVAAVVRSLGRPLFEGCASVKSDNDKTPCPHGGDCSLRPIWEHLADEVTRTLERITLFELLQKEHHIRDRIQAFRISSQ